MPAEITTLYRPVGQAELDLIRASGFKKFPPRLPEQPFFYPVTNEEYATQIARDWNTKDAASGFAGYVLRFDLLSLFLEITTSIPWATPIIESIGFRRATSANSTKILSEPSRSSLPIQPW